MGVDESGKHGVVWRKEPLAIVNRVNFDRHHFEGEVTAGECLPFPPADRYFQYHWKRCCVSPPVVPMNYVDEIFAGLQRFSERLVERSDAVDPPGVMMDGGVRGNPRPWTELEKHDDENCTGCPDCRGIRNAGPLE